jgi:hypothetical protein
MSIGINMYVHHREAIPSMLLLLLLLLSLLQVIRHQGMILLGKPIFRRLVALYSLESVDVRVTAEDHKESPVPHKLRGMRGHCLPVERGLVEAIGSMMIR